MYKKIIKKSMQGVINLALFIQKRMFPSSCPSLTETKQSVPTSPRHCSVRPRLGQTATAARVRLNGPVFASRDVLLTRLHFEMTRSPFQRLRSFCAVTYVVTIETQETNDLVFVTLHNNSAPGELNKRQTFKTTRNCISVIFLLPRS